MNLRRSAKATGARLVILNAFSGTVACMAGGFANNWFMRQAEMKRGIEMLDPDTGAPLGKSKIAARSAVI